MNRGQIASFVLLASLLAACVPETRAPANTPLPATPPATLPPSETSAPAPTLPAETLPAPTLPVASAGWTEYRDARYGYGAALPCYWLVSPTPSDGMFAAMTARSYSDEFFAAHSERGVWTGDTWPAGAYKVDVIVVEDIDPALSPQDAIRFFYATYANEQELVSVEDKNFGQHPGYIATVQGGLQGGEKIRVVFFPLQPGKLLFFAFQPDTALDSPDVQAILSSFAVAPDEPVAFPEQAPSGPPDGGPNSCS